MNALLGRIACPVLVALTVGCPTVDTRGEAASGPWAAAEASVRAGPVRGYLQTPKGGAPGTTSPNRPTLSELGIEQAVIPDAALSVGWGDHAVYGGARLIRLSSTSVSSGFRSYEQDFPAGDVVESDVNLDWYRLGYRYRLRYEYDEDASLSVLPTAGGLIWNFAMRLGTDTADASRSYRKFAPFLGMRLDWQPIPDVSIEAGFLGSLPISTSPLILSGELDVAYRLWGRDERSGQIFVGAGYESIFYEDNQEVPNQIDVLIGPLVMIGLRIGY